MINRRNFLLSTAATGLPLIFSGCATALKYSANERINIGVVGLGRIATTMDMPGVIKYPDKCRIVAVCDLDSRRLAHGKKLVEDMYAKKGISQDVVPYSELSDMLCDPRIDAVEVCLPDHWHALAASQCLAMKKHIYLQKPFAQTIEEGRILANLAYINNCVVQVGAWQRSRPQFQKVVELCLNGRLGEIKRVEVGIGLDKAGGVSAAEPVPVNLDYERWLGPTDAKAPYNWTRVHTQDLTKIGNRPGWIQMAPYGWGMITNWGAHHIDIAQWGIGKQYSGPDSVEGTCEWMDTAGGKLWNVHTTYDLLYKFGNTEVHVCDKNPMGVKFIGEKGDWLYCQRGEAKVTPSDPDVPANGKLQALMASKNKLLEPIANPQVEIIHSKDHFENWLDGIRLGDPSYTATNAEGGHRSTASCSLGHMVMELGRGRKNGAMISWDPVAEKSGNPEANAMMKPFARGKYNLPDVLAKYGYEYDTVLNFNKQA